MLNCLGSFQNTKSDSVGTLPHFIFYSTPKLWIELIISAGFKFTFSYFAVKSFVYALGFKEQTFLSFRMASELVSGSNFQIKQELMLPRVGDLASGKKDKKTKWKKDKKTKRLKHKKTKDKEQTRRTKVAVGNIESVLWPLGRGEQLAQVAEVVSDLRHHRMSCPTTHPNSISNTFSSSSPSLNDQYL